MSAVRATLALLAVFGAAAHARAERIGDIAPVDAWDQAVRFLTFADPALRHPLLGAVLLGACCGLLGGFLVVRRLALVADTLSHAVLPGIAGAVLATGGLHPAALLAGAVLAGGSGLGIVHGLRRTTPLKEDATLGIVLTVFFALGLVLLSVAQREGASVTGVTGFLLGQAAAIGPREVHVLIVVTAIAFLGAWLFYKELLVSSFDPHFARAARLPVVWIERGLFALLTFAIVLSMQAVGAVLVSALLVTPAAAAWMLTDRLPRLLALSVAFGIVSAVVGAGASYLRAGLPTGPLIVLVATAIFAVSAAFSPRHGVVRLLLQARTRRARVRRENLLKSVFQWVERNGAGDRAVPLAGLADLRREEGAATHAGLRELVRHGEMAPGRTAGTWTFTPDGWRRAARVVRNHRLWELYLAQAASRPADHVHDDAEQIEHVLGDSTVRELERRLGGARTDPHGRAIPTQEDIDRGEPPRPASGTGS